MHQSYYTFFRDAGGLDLGIAANLDRFKTALPLDPLRK